MEDSIKIILVGHVNGKSSFIRNLKGERFNDRYVPTSGYVPVPILLGENQDENKKLSVILYDTSGQELYDKPWENDLYNNSDCAIFFFKKSNRMSFNYVTKQLSKYRLMKRRSGKTPICVLYAIESNERPKITPEEIRTLHVRYMEGSNKIAGSAYDVLVATLRLLYQTLRPIKDRRPEIDEALSSIIPEGGLINLVHEYDDNNDYPYWKKLKTFFTTNSFNFSAKQSRRKRSVRKQSRRKRSVRKQSRRKRSVRKQSPRKRSVRKQSRRKRSVRKN
jgi:hypothetical protein